ncbi:MAG: hypothetical protein HY662_01680 [Chloroflexi bacterium]|nr:hypothetical protein [Chloroflexota bacterium]
MEIQYAVFCESIDAKELPPTFRRPISNIVMTDIKPFAQLEFPLFITFVGGSEGNHTLHISVVTPTRTINVPDFIFVWRRGNITQGEILTVQFQPDVFGFYVFNLTVDNNVSHKISIPFRKLN